MIKESPRVVIESQIVRQEQFPTDPEERFNSLFPAVGNSAPKCLFLMLSRRDLQTPRQFYNQFLDLSQKVWRINQAAPYAAFNQSLTPIGLVTEEDVLFDGASEYVVGFRATPAGIKYGHPIAAFLLTEAAGLKVSLKTLFGVTNTSGESRAPISRAKILEFLNNMAIGTVTRNIDIAEKLGISVDTVGSNLRHLDKLGYARYRSVDGSEEGSRKYILTAEAKDLKIVTVNTRKHLTDEVADLMLALGRASNQDLARILEEKTTDNQRAGLVNHISSVLVGLKEQGFCDLEVFEHNESFSIAKPTRRGKRLVRRLILPIRYALSDDRDTLERMRALNWESRVVQAVGRHKFESKSAAGNRRFKADAAADILKLIQNQPGIRPRDLKKTLEGDVSRSLKFLLEKGVIRTEKKGKATCCYPS